MPQKGVMNKSSCQTFDSTGQRLKSFAPRAASSPFLCSMASDWKVSIRRACSTLGIDRALYVYKSKRGD
jgi:hypothetical protein